MKLESGLSVVINNFEIADGVVDCVTGQRGSVMTTVVRQLTRALDSI